VLNIFPGYLLEVRHLLSNLYLDYTVLWLGSQGNPVDDSPSTKSSLLHSAAIATLLPDAGGDWSFHLLDLGNNPPDRIGNGASPMLRTSSIRNVNGLTMTKSKTHLIRQPAISEVS
jgi:hypothetical protein